MIGTPGQMFFRNLIQQNAFMLLQKLFFLKLPQTTALRRSLPSTVLLLLILLSPASAKTPPVPAVAANYLSALATADHLLQSWQSGDAENGMALLTNHAKEKAGPDAIDNFFSESSPSAYEIGHGKLVRRGRYEFPVVLISHAPSSSGIRRHFSTIIVLNTGTNDWAVDKLP